MKAKKPKKPTGTWLRATAAGSVAGCTRWTISRWIADGIIPDHALLKCGCQYRVARWWLEQSAPKAAS